MTESPMFVCRLFHRDQPFEQIEQRLIGEGQTTVGRDPSADWSLPDPDGVLSRVHLALMVEDGRLFVCDRSTNGTYFADGERAPRDQRREVLPRDTVRLGALTILVDEPSTAVIEDAAATLLTSASQPAIMSNDWIDPAPSAPPHRDISLIEAFCEGAKLDASSLSSEDPQELMRRVGAIYQQTILGLSLLMAERSRLKGEYDLDRTTISAASNNPFKWTPSRKLAQDLLCGNDVGFLSDVDAVRASFEDLAKHMRALAEGADAAANLVIQTLAPETIDAEAKEQGSSLLRSRQAVCWDILTRRHAALTTKGPAHGPLKQAFGAAYGRAADGERG
jgi:predicted component of type VI protein secretion system